MTGLLRASIEIHGISGNYATEHHPEDDDFVQAGHLYSLMSETEQRRLVANIAAHLSQVNKEDIIERSVSHFRNANRHYGDRVHRAVMEQRVARKYATRISI